MPREQIQWRDYQRTAIDKTKRCFRRGQRRKLIKAPTGSGKTIILGGLFQEMLFSRRQYALIIVPSIDLVNQTKDKFTKFFFQEGDIGILQAETKEYGRWITIACKDTLENPETLARYVRSIRGACALVAIDECHKSMTEKYKLILSRVMDEKTLLVGTTATAYRTDGQNLEDLFTDGVSFSIGIWELIERGHLANVQAIHIDVEMKPGDLRVAVDREVAALRAEAILAGSPDEVPRRGKLLEEFRAKVAKKIEREYRFEEFYRYWSRLTPGKRTLIFGEDLHDAYDFVERFEKKSYPGKTVSAKTPREEREAHYGASTFVLGKEEKNKFATGEVPILSNFRVLSTGTDIPEVQVLVMASKTKSRGEWTQMIGRSLRLCPELEKTSVVIFHLTDIQFTLMMHKRCFGVAAATIPSLQKELREKKEVEERERTEEQREITLTLSHARRIEGTGAHADARNTNLFTGDGWIEDTVSGSWEKPWRYKGKRHLLFVEKVGPGLFNPLHIDERGVEHDLADAALSSMQARILCQEYLEEKEAGLPDEHGGPLVLLPGDSLQPDQMRYLRQRKVTLRVPGVESKKMEDAHYDQLSDLITQEEFNCIQAFLKRYKSAYAPGIGHIGYEEGRGVYPKSWVIAYQKAQEKAKARSTTI